MCYLHGEGVERDALKAVEWLEKAAGQGDALAQNELGRCYIKGGDSISKNSALAFQWFQKSAEQGNADGQVYLAMCYHFGEGTEVDMGKAFMWYQKAAQQDNVSALMNLAEYYRDRDQKAMFNCLKKAAELGDSEASLMLGLCYFDGRGVKADLEKAAYWMKKSAAQGNEYAKELLNKKPFSMFF